MVQRRKKTSNQVLGDEINISSAQHLRKHSACIQPKQVNSPNTLGNIQLAFNRSKLIDHSESQPPTGTMTSTCLDANLRYLCVSCLYQIQKPKEKGQWNKLNECFFVVFPPGCPSNRMWYTRDWPFQVSDRQEIYSKTWFSEVERNEYGDQTSLEKLPVVTFPWLGQLLIVVHQRMIPDFLQYFYASVIFWVHSQNQQNAMSQMGTVSLPHR